MGYYINPKNEKKEVFLSRVGTITPLIPFEDVPEGKHLVCLVDNGPFTAAAICTDRREYAEFTLPEDDRRKTWLLVPDEELKPWLPAPKE